MDGQPQNSVEGEQTGHAPDTVQMVSPPVEEVVRHVDRLPGTRAVALFMHQTKGGLSVELSLEGATEADPGIADPKDPAHAIALYVQHNAIDILVQAAAWFQGVARAEKQRRQSGNGSGGAPAAANAPVLVAPRTEPVVREPILVDSSGQVIQPTPASIVVNAPVQPYDDVVLGLPDADPQTAAAPL